MALENYPWKSKALNVFAPHPDEVDRFCAFVKDELAKDGIDTIMMIVRYNYMFTSHPECRGNFPLSYEDVQKMVETCRDCGIELIPNMNLMGHQTIQDYKEPDGLLRGHPEFSETPVDEEPEYAYSLCPSHPEIFDVVTALVDELIEAFQPRYFHMGMDEIFYIGKCERCAGADPGELFAAWVNKLADHLLAKGIIPMMWGDRLLNAGEIGYGPWDASANGTWTALGKVRKEIIITDWHYYNWHWFPSPEIFAKAGHKVYLCPFNVAANAKLFLDYAKEHDQGNILGVMETTWVPVHWFMDSMEGKPLDEEKWYKGGTPHVIHCYNWLFRNGALELPKELQEEDD